MTGLIDPQCDLQADPMKSVGHICEKVQGQSDLHPMPASKLQKIRNLY